MALNGSNSNDRIVGSILDLVSQAVYLGIEAGNENFREISFVAMIAMPAEPLVLNGTILANGCLTTVSQQPRQVF